MNFKTRHSYLYWNFQGALTENFEGETTWDKFVNTHIDKISMSNVAQNTSKIIFCALNLYIYIYISLMSQFKWDNPNYLLKRFIISLCTAYAMYLHKPTWNAFYHFTQNKQRDTTGMFIKPLLHTSTDQQSILVNRILCCFTSLKTNLAVFKEVKKSTNRYWQIPSVLFAQACETSAPRI